MTSGARRVVLLPSTGYQSKSPATKISGSLANKISKFSLLLSLRHEWFTDITNYKAPNKQTFTNKAWIPRVGLTYEINENINAYGTFLKGFQPQSNTVTLMPSTGSFFWTTQSAAQFEPLKSDLKEFGLKTEWFNKKIQVTAAVYEINQENILINANDPLNPDLLVQRGADKSKGFELDLSGFLLPNWQINASYSHIDATIVNDAKAILIGERKENTPRNSANFWTRYNFTGTKTLSNIGIGFGMQHQSSKVPWFTRDFEVPAFRVFDAAIYFTPDNSNLQLALNVNNVFGTNYWLGAQNYLRLFFVKRL